MKGLRLGFLAALLLARCGDESVSSHTPELAAQRRGTQQGHPVDAGPREARCSEACARFAGLSLAGLTRLTHGREEVFAESATTAFTTSQPWLRRAQRACRDACAEAGDDGLAACMSGAASEDAFLSCVRAGVKR